MATKVYIPRKSGGFIEVELPQETAKDLQLASLIAIDTETDLDMSVTPEMFEAPLAKKTIEKLQPLTLKNMSEIDYTVMYDKVFYSEELHDEWAAYSEVEKFLAKYNLSVPKLKQLKELEVTS